ncbi:MAG TPA: DUF1501 domain-containing protein [Opitutaceae bacterium]|nr:DUF1501 domain-containing protein [Opitutaceae bacterium]HRJ45725.1 DUF1501 domain-containing protein [Opitutaceae bacterium]
MTRPTRAPISFTRRQFLRAGGAALGGLALGLVPRSLALPPSVSPADQGRILVIVRLDGGNDGINTLIPFADPAYHRLRPTLAVPVRDVLPVSPDLGLHPACKGLHALYGSGRLRLIANVGCPRPSRSHFHALEKWETATPETAATGTGWLGRYLDWTAANQRTPASAVHFTSESPLALRTANPTARVRRHPSAGDLATDLRDTAQLIEARHPASLYCLSLGGFDTHAHQATAHAQLLGKLDDALRGFQQTLNQQQLAPQVLTMVWSEFGRTMEENASLGTDHGSSGPVFLMGGIRGGLNGAAPGTDPVDFRRIYADILEDWFGCPSEPILGPGLEKLALA